MILPPDIKFPTTDIAFLKWQVAQYNQIKKENKDGYECSACNNRRFFALINAEGDFALRPCTCNNQIAQIRKEQEENETRGKRK